MTFEADHKPKRAGFEHVPYTQSTLARNCARA